MEQNTPQWLEYRKGKIGASDAAVIMKVSPWMTPYQLWRLKTGLDEPSTTSSAMQRGTMMEGEAREAYEKKTDTEMFPRVIESETHSFMIASLDGISMDGKRAVEIKCPGSEDHDKAKRGLVPEKYIPQLQHQMFVAELDKIDYWSYDGSEGVLLEVNRDDDYIKKIIDEESRFYLCMKNREAPPLTDRDYEIKEDEAYRLLEQEFLDAYNKKKEAEKREIRAREELLAHIDRNTIGSLTKATKYIKKGTIEYEKIPELIGVDLDEYRRKDFECWRISPLRSDV